MTLLSTSWARRRSRYRRRLRDPPCMSPEQRAAVATPTVETVSAGTPPAGVELPVAEHPAAQAAAAQPARVAPQHEHENPPACANCGAAVQDRFCGRCGQQLEHEMHSVLHFVREATED